MNDYKKHENSVVFDPELEINVILFIHMFKSSVFGDPRLLLLGSNANEECIKKRTRSGEDLEAMAGSNPLA
jgi:hypothetical protein